MDERFTVVLHRPQQVVNIGAVVRAMKNMGFARLRLVQPVPYTAADITRVAHRSEDVLTDMRHYATLDAAIADMVFVVGTSDHAHGQHQIAPDPRQYVPDILAQAQHGPVALLFGSEDNGLDSHALDRCHTVVRLPTDPAYPALNLAQAVLLLLYELRREIAAAPLPSAPELPRERATAAELATLFAVWEQALTTIDFFKSRPPESSMRSVRAVLHRARLDQREAALFTAMLREVTKRIRR